MRQLNYRLVFGAGAAQKNDFENFNTFSRFYCYKTEIFNEKVSISKHQQLRLK